MADLRLVPLATVGSPMEAKLMAARLGAAGIVWQLRGPVDDLYPIGDITVLVDDDELATAQVLVLGDVADDGELGDDWWWDDPDEVGATLVHPWRRRVVGASALVAAAGFGLARVAAAVS